MTESLKYKCKVYKHRISKHFVIEYILLCFKTHNFNHRLYMNLLQIIYKLGLKHYLVVMKHFTERNLCQHIKKRI